MPKSATIKTTTLKDKVNTRRSLRNKSKDENQLKKNAVEALLNIPSARQLLLETVSQNKAEIEKYKRECRGERILQYRRLAGYETPSVKHKRQIRESVLSEHDQSSTVTVPFDRKLEHVVAFVDVWSLRINHSFEVQKLMMAMGARVVKTFSIIVTHIVFQEGSDDTFKMGIANGCHIVSIWWLEAVKHCNFRVAEVTYNSLKKYATYKQISEICQINDNIISGNSTNLKIQSSAKRLKTRSQTQSCSQVTPNYKLQLVNGVVTKVKSHQRVIKVEDHKSISRKLFCDKDETEIKKTKPTIRNVKSWSFSSKHSQYSVRKVLSLPTSIEMEIMGSPVKNDDGSGENKLSNEMVSFTLHESKNIIAETLAVSDTDKKQKVTFSMDHFGFTENAYVDSDSAVKRASNKYRQLYSPMNRSQNWNNMQFETSSQCTPKRSSKTPQKRPCTITKPEVLEEVDENKKECSSRNIAINGSQHLSGGMQSNNKISVEPFKVNCFGNTVIAESIKKKIPEIISYNNTIYNDLKKVTMLLGRFNVNKKITDETTHLVVESDVMSYEVLKGITKGCWILCYDWLAKSYRQGKWLPEEQFELKHLCPAIEVTRIQRQDFGVQCPVKLFRNCGPFYLLEESVESYHLRQLIEFCSGTVSNSLADSWIAIECHTPCIIPRVSKYWVISCIKQNTLISIDHYLLK